MVMKAGRLLAVGALVWALAMVGCTDEIDDPGEWDIGERLGEWESLGGPPGAYHRYLGEIEGRHYFEVTRYSHLATVDPQVFMYEPGTGWESNDELAEISAASITELSEPTSLLGAVITPIATVGGAHFVMTRPGRLYRSEDGLSWTEQERLPGSGEHWPYPMATDGNALFVRERGPDTIRLWRKVPGSQRWEQLGEEEGGTSAFFRSNVTGVNDLVVTTFPDPGFSKDSGENWDELGPSCLDEGRIHGPMFEYDGDVYFGGGASLYRFDHGMCERIDIGVPTASGADEMADGAVRYTVVDDELYGLSESAWARASEDLSGWEEVWEPSGPMLSSLPRWTMSGMPGVIDLGGGRLGLNATNGLWQAERAGEEFEEISYEASTPRWIYEEDGQVITSDIQVYGYGLREQSWSRYDLAVDEQEEFAPTRLIRRGEMTFGVASDNNTVHLRDDDGFERIWPSESEMVWPQGLTEVEVTGGLVFLGLPGGDPIPVSDYEGSDPQDPNKDGMIVPPGGVLSSDLGENGNFEEFGIGFPTGPYGTPSGVLSMAVDGEHLWVVVKDGEERVWRTDLNDPEWTSVSSGLPEGAADSQPDPPPVGRIGVFDGRLYAWSIEKIYRYEEGKWQRVNQTRFRDYDDHDDEESGPVARPTPELLSYNGGLYFAYHDGVYAVNPSTGEIRREWQPEQGFVTSASVEASGMYIGVINGGLWRHSPR